MSLVMVTLVSVSGCGQCCSPYHLDYLGSIWQRYSYDTLSLSRRRRTARCSRAYGATRRPCSTTGLLYGAPGPSNWEDRGEKCINLMSLPLSISPSLHLSISLSLHLSISLSLPLPPSKSGIKQMFSHWANVKPPTAGRCISKG